MPYISHDQKNLNYYEKELELTHCNYKGHKCNGNLVSLLTLIFKSFAISQKRVYSQHFVFFSLKYKCWYIYIWVCHDLVKTKMVSRQRRKKKVQNVTEGITSSTFSSIFSILSKEAIIDLS